MVIAIFQVLLIPVLIFFNAFFVAAEMGLARIRRTRVDQLAEDGNKAALLVKKNLDKPDRFISACQLGITLATLALGAVGEEAFAHDLGNFMVDVFFIDPVLSPHLVAGSKVACYAFAFASTAFLQTVFGELIPKTWTFQRAESTLFVLIYPMEAWCWLTTPFNNILNGFTAFVLGLLKVKEPPRHHISYSEEELKMLVSASHEEGVIEEKEEEMLHSVIDFSDTLVHEVMSPKLDMVCISANSSVKDFVDLALKHGHSRLPVYEEDIDTIFGAVHIRDALRALIERKENSRVRELARKILIVPENKNIGDLLTEFRKTKTHMAVVVDEYGGVRGLATIEDLLEELVGDIADEHEIVEEYIQEQADGSVLLDAAITLDECEKSLSLNIEDDQFNTLGGHVFGLLGREPKVGDEVEENGYILRVEEADRHRITKLRLVQKAEHDGQSETEAESTSGDHKTTTEVKSSNGNKPDNGNKTENGRSLEASK